MKSSQSHPPNKKKHPLRAYPLRKTKESLMRNLTQAIYIICRCTHIFYAREVKKLHLTMGQFPFLMEIVDNDGISQEKHSTGFCRSRIKCSMMLSK